LQGWEIKGNFSRAVTLVVVKAIGKETEKTRKARENGIKIITREDFERLFN
jgi:NAD-dependent DNA ligase